MAKARKNTPKQIIVDDETIDKLADFLNPPGYGHGYDQLQKDAFPYPEMKAAPSSMELIPQSEWSERIKERVKAKADGMSFKNRMNRGKPHKSLDQNGQGYCWAYSVVHTVMYQNARQNKTYKRLSAHAVACIVKDFRDQGGWCGLSAAFIRGDLKSGFKGVPDVEYWPEKSMSSSHNNAETWENAQANIITEDWVDLTKPIYDRNLTFQQVATVLLSGDFCAVDYNWWGHSIAAIDLVEVEPGSFGLLIDNSWSSGWGNQGTTILRGEKAPPDGAVATRVVTGG